MNSVETQTLRNDLSLEMTLTLMIKTINWFITKEFGVQPPEKPILPI